MKLLGDGVFVFSVWRINELNIKKQGLVRLGKEPSCAYAHGTKGITVISIAEGNDLIPFLALIAPILQSHFNSYFYRCRAIVGIEDFGMVRYLIYQPFCEYFSRLMCKACKDHVLQFPCLFSN